MLSLFTSGYGVALLLNTFFDFFAHLLLFLLRPFPAVYLPKW